MRWIVAVAATPLIACSAVSPTRPLASVEREGVEAYRLASSFRPAEDVSFIVAYSSGSEATIEVDAESDMIDSVPLICLNLATCGALYHASRVRSERSLQPEEWAELRRRIDESGFWSGAKVRTRYKTDGWFFTLEGMRHDQRRTLEGSNPEMDDPMGDAVKHLWDLAFSE